MKKDRMNEFAFCFGKILGLISSEDIKTALKEQGATEQEINLLFEYMKTFAVVFYNQ